VPPDPPDPAPRDDTEAQRRAAYLDHNLGVALLGLVLFAVALWGA
jgi:hypothetical protein